MGDCLVHYSTYVSVLVRLLLLFFRAQGKETGPGPRKHDASGAHSRLSYFAVAGLAWKSVPCATQFFFSSCIMYLVRVSVCDCALCLVFCFILESWLRELVCSCMILL
ncbi:hypothetical protein O6H91_02G060100 [Diphasiastrum complanatum]|uniref:Uncharacterized protein n=1 Tax=Diphasiastrum complanatum TaxID=34168 RepID=A0ACC2EG07_DIPCM|nr:hypothetical protein O6H91_02G060100 [Diphasiastrum complanatum]